MLRALWIRRLRVKTNESHKSKSILCKNTLFLGIQRFFCFVPVLKPRNSKVVTMKTVKLKTFSSFLVIISAILQKKKKIHDCGQTYVLSDKILIC